MDKIAKIQREIGKMQKDHKVEFGKTKYAYFNIEQLLDKLIPLLEKYELIITQPLSSVNGRPALKTIVYDNGEIIINEAVALPDIDDPQKMGSAVTYFRRYALQSLFMLQTEDDDGRSAKADKKFNNPKSLSLPDIDEDLGF